MIDWIARQLRLCADDSSVFPPTVLYNEGWLLRLVLDWFSSRALLGHPLSFSESARWFSEAHLPSAFLSRRRGDPLGESWTHADGVIGHFDIGESGRSDLTLQASAQQFVVVEAKMFSRLSSGVSHARYFDQAARTAACIAETLHRTKRRPDDVAKLGFYVLAPQAQIAGGIFNGPTDKASISEKVQRRVATYAGTKDDWYVEWFEPALQAMEIDCISWEDVLAEVSPVDRETGEGLWEFYAGCLRFNQPVRPHVDEIPEPVEAPVRQVDIRVLAISK